MNKCIFDKLEAVHILEVANKFDFSNDKKLLTRKLSNLFLKLACKIIHNFVIRIC